MGKAEKVSKVVKAPSATKAIVKKSKKAPEPEPEPVIEDEDDEEIESVEDEEEDEDDESGEESEEEEEEEAEDDVADAAEDAEDAAEDAEDAAEEGDGQYKDMTINCKDCNKNFIFSVEEQVLCLSCAVQIADAIVHPRPRPCCQPLSPTALAAANTGVLRGEGL